MKNLLLTKTNFRTTCAEVFHGNDVKLRVRMAICRCEIAVVLSRLYFLYDLLLPAFYGVTEMDNGERENENDNKTERTGNEVTFRPTPRNYCKNCSKIGQCKLALVLLNCFRNRRHLDFCSKVIAILNKKTLLNRSWLR